MGTRSLVGARLAVVLLVIVCAACGGSPIQPTPPPESPSPPGPSPTPEPPVPPQPPPPPELSVTRIVAFGDSMTEGVLSRTTFGLTDAPASSYPTQLQNLLTGRYTAQTIRVLNEGKAGERAEQGVDRLPGALQTHRPEVLLLMEGANDLNAFGRAGMPRAARAIELMIRDAHARGVQVMLATLPPQRPGGRSAAAASFLTEYNDQLRLVAADEGAILVDVFAGFGNDLSLIGADGLHPTEAGYLRIAETFFSAIQMRFEVSVNESMSQ